MSAVNLNAEKSNLRAKLRNGDRLTKDDLDMAVKIAKARGDNESRALYAQVKHAIDNETDEETE